MRQQDTDGAWSYVQNNIIRKLSTVRTRAAICICSNQPPRIASNKAAIQLYACESLTFFTNAVVLGEEPRAAQSWRRQKIRRFWRISILSLTMVQMAQMCAHSHSQCSLVGVLIWRSGAGKMGGDERENRSSIVIASTYRARHSIRPLMAPIAQFVGGPYSKTSLAYTLSWRHCPFNTILRTWAHASKWSLSSDRLLPMREAQGNTREPQPYSNAIAAPERMFRRGVHKAFPPISCSLFRRGPDSEYSRWQIHFLAPTACSPAHIRLCWSLKMPLHGPSIITTFLGSNSFTPRVLTNPKPRSIEGVEE